MPTRRPLEWFEQMMERRDLAAHEKAEYIAVLNEELKKARAAAEQGERDRERLDWLCGEVFTGATNVSGRFAVAYRIWDGASDFREALDAARQPRQEGDR